MESCRNKFSNFLCFLLHTIQSGLMKFCSRQLHVPSPKTSLLALHLSSVCAAQTSVT